MKIQGNIVTLDRVFFGEVVIDGRIISSIRELSAKQAGAPLILPGFINLHLHGVGEYNVEQGEMGVRGMAAFAATKGTTRLCPTYSCAPEDEMVDWLKAIRRIMDTPDAMSAIIAGAHAEGPWLSLRFCGGMNPEMLQKPTAASAMRFIEAADGALKMMTIAPETPGAIEVIRVMRQHGVVMSMGHTDCPPERFGEMVEAGITEICHLYDAYDVPVSLSGVRQPAVTDLALIEDRTMKEIIMDGLHVPPALITLARRSAGCDHIIAITDGLQGAGLPEGHFMDCGRPYTIREGELARLDDQPEIIVGSSLTMNRAFFNMVTRFGFTMPEAVRCLSYNPARQLGLSGETGQLGEGLSADIAVLEADALTVKATFLEGRMIYQR